MIAPDLFEFAYVPDWYGHLAELERLALPESWKFRKPSRETKNADTPILERYIHTIFRKQVIDFNSESDPRKADSIFHLENECVCFHTGLYTPQYKGIYGYFERNNFSDSLRDWYFRGFCDELSPKLRYIEPLPQKPVYHMAQSGINFNPEWPIRVNVNHILGDEENLERIPAKIRKVKNLPLLFETAVELGRRKSVIEPGLVVPQGYQGRVQYLLPVYLTNMQKPDLAMTLTVMDGYYLGNTCLTLEMAYLNARVVARPMAPWLLDEEAVLKYTFEVPTAGTYDVAVEIVYPRWDKNSIGISLDGDSQMLSESRMYFLYWRKKFWRILKSGVSLSAGKHTITVSGGVPGVVFYGFRVCSDFSQKATAGEVYYGLKPRKFMDVNGEMVQPDRAFKVTAEVLRRKPESALVWYEDFCDYSEIPTNYFTVLDGSWKIWKDESSDRVRKYSQLEGSGKLALDYTGFSEIHVRARFAFKSSGGGKAGVFLGSIFCCINYDTQCVELYQGSKKLGSYASSFSKTSNADLRSNPSLYTVEMRIRGNKVRVYSGAAYTLRFTATITAETGYVGFMAEKGVVCDLLRLGDAWYYEPYECFDITFPDGKQTTFGRCTRTGISWDNEFELFRVNSDVEEISTRSQDISMDYDFFHSHEMSLECGNDYEMKVVPHDLNVWLSRMYLGDADGFSIMYYSDVDSIVYWANEAAYTYGVSGIAIWSLGQEDMRLWDSMPDQI